VVASRVVTDAAARVPIPLAVRTDPAHGGRWTSLRGGGREWLWRRDEPRRAQVEPGDSFADAGGLEECVPTVRGRPDHGDAWSRPWTEEPGTEESESVHSVRCDDFELTRTLRVTDGVVVADYQLSAEPGYRFLWAAHALLDLTGQARLIAAPGSVTRLFPEAAGQLEQPWPDQVPWIEGAWPDPAGFRLDTLGPDDGTAVGAVLFEPDAHSATVSAADGPDLLTLTVEAQRQPVSVALWRNLGGFPQPQPYRSIGVEPMLGRVFDIADAADAADAVDAVDAADASEVTAADCAVTPAGGEVRWRLTIAAFRETGGN
jgi:hypothetical protein